MTELEEIARRHLLLHFTRLSTYKEEHLPIIVRGEGCWVWDADGKRYFDGMSGLFCVGIGYSFGEEIGEAVKQQMRELPYWSNWSSAHPRSIELAARLAELAPGDLGHVFFVSSGSEANESILKFVRQYHQLSGQPRRYKMIARRTAYHGSTLATTALTGITAMRVPFEPLMTVRHISNTNRYRRPEEESEAQFTGFLLTELEESIEAEGPETVAAVFMEPVQSAGGSFVPPSGYFEGVRQICDRYGVLLVADEVATGFGRLGEWFGSIRYDIRPDLIAFAKGVGSAYVPLGGALIADRLVDPFLEGRNLYLHGFTYGGHPAACAAALKNLEIIEREDVIGNVQRNEDYLRSQLETLLEKPIVGDVRGAGYLYALELVKEKDTKETFDDDEREYLLRNFLSRRLFEAGLICRADDRGDPVIMISPPLIATRDEIDWAVDVLDTVLDEAWVEMTATV